MYLLMMAMIYYANIVFLHNLCKENWVGQGWWWCVRVCARAVVGVRLGWGWGLGVLGVLRMRYVTLGGGTRRTLRAVI